VFRFDPATGQTRPVAKDFERPNGLCFSPNEKKLYVADSGRRHVRAFAVQKDGSLTGGEVFCQIDRGVPDGIRCDATGRLYSSAGDGVHIFQPDGGRVGKIMVPETPANLAFGGKDYKTLFITARSSLYAIRLAVRGAR
jgi:gluconolactonase